MTPRSGNNNLLALGSAAVLAVYSAGYVRTKPAADRLAAQSSGRRRDVASDGSGETGREMPPAAPSGMSNASAPVGTGSDSLTLALHDTTVVLRDARATIPAGGAESARPAASQPKPVSAASSMTAAVPALGAVPSVSTQSAVAQSVIAPPLAVAAPVTAAADAPPVQPVKAADPVVSPPKSPAAPPVVAAPATTAPAAVAVTTSAAPAAAPAAATKLRDGMFLGRGTSRHGDIEAMVEVSNGRIISAVISQCLTRYSCSWIADLPPQVVSRQSPDVDNVSGATESANAFYYAIRQALQQAK